MKCKNLLVLLVSVFAFAFVMSSVSAFGTIEKVEFDDLVVYPTATPINLANFAGDRIPVEITFKGDNMSAPATDVRVKAWISGEKENIAVSERFAVEPDTTYKRTVYLDIPTDLNDELKEVRSLEIVVENRAETADQVSIDFTVQRESYVIEILSVDMQNKAHAGDSIVADVVLKNRGRQTADDTFLRIRIPELGLETSTYFGDLTPVDQSNPDKEDAVERRTFLKIPLNAPAGLYTVEFEASNADSITTTERRVLIDGAEEDTMIVSSTNAKTFGVGEMGEYKITLVNRGSLVRVYEITASSSSGLNLEVSDAVTVVPAGSSRTVSIFADASQRDDYTFVVTVTSDGNLVGEKTFVANVEENGGSEKGGTSFTGDSTVLLTVILAIVFIVLLVVLIVLLTRKTESKEELGESYY